MPLKQLLLAIEKPYWWVAVGEDNGMSFVTHYGFLVYIRSGKIFYDAAEEEIGVLLLELAAIAQVAFS